MPPLVYRKYQTLQVSRVDIKSIERQTTGSQEATPSGAKRKRKTTFQVSGIRQEERPGEP